MTTDSDGLITSLKVIAQLKAGGRLSTRGDQIEVDTSSGVWQAALRWLQSESRSSNIDHVSTIVATAIEQLQSRATDETLHLRISSELSKTAEGIRNLKLTYRGCSVSTARLDVLIENIIQATTNQSRDRGDSQ